MKNLTLGKKITLGFGALIAIAFILGSIAVVNMQTAQRLATNLATKYVPESDLAGKLETAFAVVMINARSYGLTYEDGYMQKMIGGLAGVNQNLAALQKLADENAELVKLRAAIKELTPQLKTFESLVSETTTKVDEIVTSRKAMDAAASEFAINIDELIARQDSKYEQESAAGAEPARLLERKKKLLLAENIQEEGNHARLANFKAQALRNPALLEEGLLSFDTMDQHISTLMAMLKISEDIEELNRVKASAHKYRDLMKQIQAGSAALADVNKRRITAAEGLQAMVEEVQDIGVRRTTDSAAESKANLTHASYVMIIGLLVALVVGVSLSIWIVRGITKVLNQVTTSLADGSEQIASAATQVSLSSQSTAEGASEQAASLEETSASLEEISSMTKRNTENADSCKSLSSQACASANTGLMTLGELSRTLASIQSAVGEMQAAVTETQTSSQEISKIIKTIDEIAFQTNLLALNAAVEAARAGEAGMGFAVVADEVRALAQRSAQAARDTADKIEVAVKRSELGGVANTKVVKSLAEVEATAQSIQQVFNGIVSQVQSVDRIIAEIAAASKEQSQGISEVNMAVSQMDKVTQGNAANAEENAASSEELNAQAATLQDLVGQLELLTQGQRRAVASSGQSASRLPSKFKAAKSTLRAKPGSATPVGRDVATAAFGHSATGKAATPQAQAAAIGDSFQSF